MPWVVPWQSNGQNLVLSLLWPEFKLWSRNKDSLNHAALPNKTKQNKTKPDLGGNIHIPCQVCTFMLLLLLLSRFSRVRLSATAQMVAHQAPPSLGLSRQEHWSGLPFAFSCPQQLSDYGFQPINSCIRETEISYPRNLISKSLILLGIPQNCDLRVESVKR